MLMGILAYETNIFEFEVKFFPVRTECRPNGPVGASSEAGGLLK